MATKGTTSQELSPKTTALSLGTLIFVIGLILWRSTGPAQEAQGQLGTKADDIRSAFMTIRSNPTMPLDAKRDAVTSLLRQAQSDSKISAQEKVNLQLLGTQAIATGPLPAPTPSSESGRRMEAAALRQSP